ncbi:MAG: sensor domain-containing diguanylate cyclase [Sulfuricellaceae bacterium]|nr:sensor domain-containing diguanylate cyclase [Sulfuricellaceae bacterium]
MDHDLFDENRTLRLQLKKFLSEARKNEEKMRRFDAMERKLIGTRSLFELIDAVICDYREAFGLDKVTLALVDPDYELLHLLDSGGHTIEQLPDLIFLSDHQPLDVLFDGSGAPVLAAYQDALHEVLFGYQSCKPARIALLPLIQDKRIVGSLNLGCSQPNRFMPGEGTDFLRRLAFIVAVCLENAGNHERLKLVGLTDPLTGVSNRRYFEQRFRDEVSGAQRHAESLSCMFLDVDRFKRINDSLGHQVGDEVLKAVARMIKTYLRGSDIIARYGGEEFVAILPRTPANQAYEVAERIRAAIAEHPFGTASGDVAVTISIGVSTCHAAYAEQDVGLTVQSLISQADRAVYAAKESGRNRVVHADSAAGAEIRV